MDQLRVSTTEFRRNIGRFLDIAERQPVAVTNNGLERCVLISIEEYRRLKRRAREVLSIEEFSDADAEIVRNSDSSEQAKAFNHEMTDGA